MMISFQRADEMSDGIKMYRMNLKMCNIPWPLATSVQKPNETKGPIIVKVQIFETGAWFGVAQGLLWMELNSGQNVRLSQRLLCPSPRAI